MNIYIFSGSGDDGWKDLHLEIVVALQNRLLSPGYIRLQPVTKCISWKGQIPIWLSYYFWVPVSNYRPLTKDIARKASEMDELGPAVPKLPRYQVALPGRQDNARDLKNPDHYKTE